MQGSGADPKIRFSILAHALPAPAFAEGWHLHAGLDYLTTLGAHSDASFTALMLEEAVPKIDAELRIGDPVSVYGTCGAGRLESAHLIHCNKTNEDGAIVLTPPQRPASCSSISTIRRSRSQGRRVALFACRPAWTARGFVQKSRR